MVENLPASAEDVRDVDLIPGSERSPGRGHGNAFQYFCLENPMDRGAWKALGVKSTEHNLVTEQQLRALKANAFAEVSNGR